MAMVLVTMCMVLGTDLFARRGMQQALHHLFFIHVCRNRKQRIVSRCGCKERTIMGLIYLVRWTDLLFIYPVFGTLGLERRRLV